ncbi:MAG: hypothetical protein COZ18_06665 [Flexibacter sp. CG_4_10_14_3_um_filter_32_15]|nr:MAG: hypothetical protein COZ18_06665 [Flexibacter sp. CG_4_10_14_3_um_filter_32_15]
MQKNKSIRKWYFRLSFYLMILLGMGTTLTTTSCGAKKKAAAAQAQAAAEKKRKIEKATSDLQAVLNDTSMSAEERQKRIDAIKAMNIDDPSVKDLIAQAEQSVRQQRIKEEEERRQKEAEAEANKKSKTIKDFFTEIANASDANAANASIQNALKLFTSPNADVLIIIAEEGGEKDYDEPTTAEKYLNFIKDQKKMNHKIVSIGTDENGKIKLLELSN